MAGRKITIKKIRKAPKKTGEKLPAKKERKIAKSKPKIDKKVDKKELLNESRDWQEHFPENEKIHELKAPKEHKEMDESDKRIMMWAGVTFFMVLILFIWILNIKSVFKTVERQETTEDFNWAEIREDFSATMAEIEQGLGELKEVVPAEESDNALPEEIEQNGVDVVDVDEDEILELKSRLEELEKKVEGE